MPGGPPRFWARRGRCVCKRARLRFWARSCAPCAAAPAAAAPPRGKRKGGGRCGPTGGPVGCAAVAAGVE
eukprot:9989306-Lingulodinium_polyedra.AAC.1